MGEVTIPASLSQTHHTNKIMTLSQCYLKERNYSSWQRTETTRTTRNTNNIVRWNPSTISFTTSQRTSYQFSKISWFSTTSTSFLRGLTRMPSKSRAYRDSSSSTSATWWRPKCTQDAWTPATTPIQIMPRCCRIRAITYLRILRDGSACGISETTSSARTWRLTKMKMLPRMPIIVKQKKRKKRRKKHRRGCLTRNSWKVYASATKTSASMTITISHSNFRLKLTTTDHQYLMGWTMVNKTQLWTKACSASINTHQMLWISRRIKREMQESATPQTRSRTDTVPEILRTWSQNS